MDHGIYLDIAMENGMNELGPSLSWSLAVLGGLWSAMSIIKLMVFGFDVGLIPLLEQFVDFYRNMVKPLYDLVALIPFAVPEWAVDIVIIYAIGVTLTYRFSLAYQEASLRVSEMPIEWYKGGGIEDNKKVSILLALFLPYLALLFALDSDFNPVPDYASGHKQAAKAESIYRQCLLSLFLVPIATVVFFAYNAVG